MNEDETTMKVNTIIPIFVISQIPNATKVANTYLTKAKPTHLYSCISFIIKMLFYKIQH